MFQWNSEQYSRFLKERTQASIDLVNRIDMQDPQYILDLGCGPGNSTRTLKDKYPKAHILGIDNSVEMIEAAKKNNPDLGFRYFDANNDFADLQQKFDLVFSNACIQWVPNHKKLLQNIMSSLNDKGVLAVQTPMNYQEPIHKIIQTLAESKKWKDYFESPRIFYNLKQEEYFNLLSKLAKNFSLWETTYLHRLPSHESIMDWYKGTGLRPYLAQLTEPKAKEFEQEIFVQLLDNYPVQENKEIIFRFPRFFFIAVK